MAYSQNPHLPKVRMFAVRKVKYEGWSIRKSARYFGVEPSTVLRWCKKDLSGGWRRIPTISSKPRHHPHELPRDVVHRILELRHERNQCAEILHHRLTQEGVPVSLSSVKRTLNRYGISRFSKWKKWHQYPPRPNPKKPGILIQIDSMHDGASHDRLSAYACIDVCSRWAHAAVSERINSHRSLRFLTRARTVAPFTFVNLQSDHGSEFSKWFTTMVEHQGVSHRHSRVRTPTDNSHVERFILTLQRECLKRIPRTFASWKKEIPEFILYYNNERPHMALNYQTPQQVLRSY